MFVGNAVPRKHRFKLYDPRGYLIYVECELDDPKRTGKSYALQAYAAEDLARALIPISVSVYQRWKERLKRREKVVYGRFRIRRVVRAKRPPKLKPRRRVLFWPRIT
jgi:hypothetical protein